MEGFRSGELWHLNPESYSCILEPSCVCKSGIVGGTGREIRIVIKDE